MCDLQEITMSGGRRNILNLDADSRFGDPAAVSNPECWITGEAAETLKQIFPRTVRSIRQSPSYKDDDQVLDLSAENLPK